MKTLDKEKLHLGEEIEDKTENFTQEENDKLMTSNLENSFQNEEYEKNRAIKRERDSSIENNSEFNLKKKTVDEFFSYFTE